VKLPLFHTLKPIVRLTRNKVGPFPWISAHVGIHKWRCS